MFLLAFFRQVWYTAIGDCFVAVIFADDCLLPAAFYLSFLSSFLFFFLLNDKNVCTCFNVTDYLFLFLIRLSAAESYLFYIYVYRSGQNIFRINALVTTSAIK